MLDLHLSAVGYAFEEEGIAAIDITLQYSLLVCIHRAGAAAECGVLVGLYLVKLYAQLLCEQLASVWDDAEDSDTSGECSRLSHNPVGVAAHVVATRCGHSTHRYYHWFLLLEHLYLVPHLLRGISAAASRVDAQYNGFDIFVVGKFLQVFAHVGGYDVVVVAQQAS